MSSSVATGDESLFNGLNELNRTGWPPILVIQTHDKNFVLTPYKKENKD